MAGELNVKPWDSLYLQIRIMQLNALGNTPESETKLQC